MKVYVVWNENKTEGFVTTDPQLAYDVRKGNDSNCYFEDGSHAPLAAFTAELFDVEEINTYELEDNE